RLEDVRGGVVEAEQDRERPAAGKRRAEHLCADQDRRRDDGDDARPDDRAGGGGGGLWAHEKGPVQGRNLSEKAPSIKRKRPKNAASRDIDCRMFSRKRREL